MEHIWHCDRLADEVDLFVAAVVDADLATPVPTCPGWDLAELIRHTGLVHRWAGYLVEHTAPQRVPSDEVGTAFPDDDASLPQWLGEGGRALVAILRAADPATSMWAWGPDPHVRFWSRRQLHETAVHRADAQLAIGEAPVIEPAVAVDAVDELLANVASAGYFAPNTERLRGEGESIHLHCTDAAGLDGEWMITLLPDRFEWSRAHGKATVAVQGPASDLLLLVYNRRSRADDRFEIFGDVALLDFWLENSAL